MVFSGAFVMFAVVVLMRGDDGPAYGAINGVRWRVAS